jgi:hypothetical protein
MRVHLPKPLHGWREFIHEITIVVLGVLIALAANQLVENWAWAIKVRHAEAAMRLELAEDDGPEAYGRVIIGPCLDAQLARIHSAAGRVSTTQLREWVRAYAPPFRTWDSEAWKMTLGSDVGSHMGPERLIRWSSPYRVLLSLSDANAKERELAVEFHEALSPAGDASPAELQAVRRYAAQLQVLNGSFFRSSQLVLARSRANGATIPAPIERALLSEARAIYGDCVRAPDPRATPVGQNLTANLRSIGLR